MHRLRMFRCGRRAGVNPLRRGPLLKTIFRLADLMPLRDRPTMTQYRRCCRYYAFHKAEQNFIKIFKAR